MSTRIRNLALLTCLALVFAGGLVSTYLLARTFALKAGVGDESADVCSAVFGINCDQVLLDPLSTQLGIPLAGWGLIYFGVLATLLLLGIAVGGGGFREAWLVAFVWNLGGAAISLILLSSFLTDRFAACPLCIAIHALNLVHLPVVYVAAGYTPAEALRALRTGVTRLSPSAEATPEATWKAIGFLVPVLVGVVVYQAIAGKVDNLTPTTDRAPSLNTALIEFLNTPIRSLPEDDDVPTMGAADPVVRLTVFSDFECPACRSFARRLAALLEKHPAALAVQYRHFPLDSDCNRVVGRTLHPHACDAAHAAEAAKAQGQYWAYHEALFTADLTRGDGELARIAEDIGLDVEQFNADRMSPDTAETVRRDVELGIALGVAATPSIIVNGRRSPSSNFEIVSGLIEISLAFEQGPGATPVRWEYLF